MKFLLDANLWLELLLDRPGSPDVAHLLRAVPGPLCATTDFALAAVGIFVTKRRPELFLRFLDDLIANQIGVLHLPPSALRQVATLVQSQQLSFDDAFQYVAAERDDLTLVSFDADFDRTPRGRKTPGQVMAELGLPTQP